MKKIITIQHTQSEQHTNGMIGSWADWNLTGIGMEQARRIGQRLSEEIRDERYVMYSSDLLRARYTAQIVAGFLDIVPIFTDVLREFYLGEAIGKSKEWARANTQCKVWPQTVDWAVSVDEKPFIGAESKREVWHRLLPFYNQIITSPEENIIIVSHDGTLSLFYAMWLGFEVNLLERCELSGKSGGVSILVEDAECHRMITRLNDLSYIS